MFHRIPSKLADSEKSSKAAFREHYATITIASCYGNSVKEREPTPLPCPQFFAIYGRGKGGSTHKAGFPFKARLNGEWMSPHGGPTFFNFGLLSLVTAPLTKHPDMKSRWSSL